MERLRFPLRALLLFLAMAAVCLTFYVRLMRRPSLVVRQLTNSQAEVGWLYGPSPIEASLDAEEGHRFTAIYRPRNRKAVERINGRFRRLVSPGDLPTAYSYGLRSSLDVRIRSPERRVVEAVLNFTAEQDSQTAPGTICFIGVVRDAFGKAVPGAMVGVTRGSQSQGIGARDDGTFQLVLPADSSSLRPGWRFRVAKTPTPASWLQGGGNWFTGSPRMAVQPDQTYQIEIRLPSP